jgi:hypothetical protein
MPPEAWAAALLLLGGTCYVRLSRDLHRVRRRLDRIDLERRRPATFRPGPKFGVYRGPEVPYCEGHDDQIAN